VQFDRRQAIPGGEVDVTYNVTDPPLLDAVLRTLETLHETERALEASEAQRKRQAVVERQLEGKIEELERTLRGVRERQNRGKGQGP
jgi:hypothetical protein